MLIRRCCWHPKYYASRKLLGVVRWWPLWRVQYTDGLCGACERQFFRDDYIAEKKRDGSPA